MRQLFGVCIILAGIVFGIWLAIVIMLYGGIMQAVNSWGVNNPAVVWGVIRAVFFEMGFIPGYLLGIVGLLIVRG